jgi:hypothetical protein
MDLPTLERFNRFRSLSVQGNLRRNQHYFAVSVSGWQRVEFLPRQWADMFRRHTGELNLPAFNEADGNAPFQRF